jgi:tryptophanyl-tRNA synthetase
VPLVALTGIKPTAQPHVGNWLGSVRPGLALAQDPGVRAFYFIADHHALTSVHDAAELRRLTHEVAATWLAFGLDPERTTLYRQSDIPEIFELSWILACMSPKGFMNKAHAYKAARDRNEQLGHDPDEGVNMGLYTYPVLMAADILIVDADVVPVGQDQVQHVEIARDLAQRVNHTFGADVLRLPTAKVQGEAAVVPGLDGRKMSKSYGNTLPCFAPPKPLRKAVMRIETDSTPPEAPKDPETSLVFQIHRSFLDEPAREALAAEYRAGISWGAAKQKLAEDLEARLAEPRAAFDRWMADPGAVEDLLQAGAERVRPIARATLARVRDAIGIRSLR